MTPAYGSILLAGDEGTTLRRLGSALRDEGHDFVEATTALEAQRHLNEQAFDLLIVDTAMPGMADLNLVRELANTMTSAERPQIVAMTAHGTTPLVREALTLGIEDALEEPFEFDKLLTLARRAVRSLRLQTERQYLISERDAEFNDYEIVERSLAMKDIVQRAELAAQTTSTVLITGDTGTGKEMIARLIHHRSAQRDMPLIKVNCAATQETRLESVLFGNVCGSVTGASVTKRGAFALADGGSILLYEIGALSNGIQSKLLRVLRQREFAPAGAERPHHVDARVIAATNRDLQHMVNEGRFQADLYSRLHMTPIALPPLRERRDDIPALVDHFVGKHRVRTGKRIDGIDGEAAEALQAYDWPGNVRELDHTIERAVVLATGPLLTAASLSLPGAPTVPTSALPSLRLHQNVEWVERETIQRSLSQAGGIKKDAAKLMGISQRALSYYLRKYWID